MYEEALKKSGYYKKVTYKPEKQKTNNKNNRKRNIIWFNPPINQSVSTNNGNSVKISYSCTKNIKSIINNHNNKILNDNKEINNETKCNCIQKDECPLNGICLTQNTVYQASITSNEPNYEEKKYIGISEPTFKKRYANHPKIF